MFSQSVSQLLWLQSPVSLSWEPTHSVLSPTSLGFLFLLFFGVFSPIPLFSSCQSRPAAPPPSYPPRSRSCLLGDLPACGSSSQATCPPSVPDGVLRVRSRAPAQSLARCPLARVPDPQGAAASGSLPRLGPVQAERPGPRGEVWAPRAATGWPLAMGPPSGRPFLPFQPSEPYSLASIHLHPCLPGAQQCPLPRVLTGHFFQALFPCPTRASPMRRVEARGVEAAPATLE